VSPCRHHARAQCAASVRAAHVTRHAESPPPDRPAPPTPPPPPPAWRHWLLFLGLSLSLAVVFVLPYFTGGGATSETLSYSQFLSAVDNDKVASVSIAPDGQSTGLLKSGTSFTTVIPVSLSGQNLLDHLTSADVTVTAVATTASSPLSTLLSWLLTLSPFLLLGWLWWRLSSSRGQSGGIMGVRRSSAKLFESAGPKTTFADVAGYEGVKAEVMEVVDFLREPDRYLRLGAKAPRGELMIGPPGTGKTLLARAVAGEANVPFFSVEGSSFVEMFVGVGAARVRDLFAEARKRAPAIIFIDEIDAIGQRRSSATAFASNDEREQTLNQLLAEMDGFEASTGIVVLAATNRPDVLDPALLRPGRFDRRITIPLPMVTERAAILAVHCTNKPLDPAVDLTAIARGTPGFSGADLANLANESAIEAVRGHRDHVTAADFDAARDRLLLGRRDSSNVLLPEEKRAVAVHESGHALVAALCEHADPVARITILPAGESLGVTQQLPLVERHIYGLDALDESLAVRLGGRAAELVVFGQGSTGATNDLAGATELAAKMVREFGLSPRIGPVGYPTGEDGIAGGRALNRPFAEATQAVVDEEVARILREAEARAIDLISSHRDILDRLSARLITEETVDGAVVYELLGRPVPDAPDGSVIAPGREAPNGVAAVTGT
jgi:cell division protease FtsH